MLSSTSRRGTCHDNAVAESFGALKKERIQRRIYPTRATASSDVFDYIERLHNPIRRHGSAGGLSPIAFERRYAQNGCGLFVEVSPDHRLPLACSRKEAIEVKLIGRYPLRRK